MGALVVGLMVGPGVGSAVVGFILGPDVGWAVVGLTVVGAAHVSNCEIDDASVTK